jgi:hypothetical protein
MSPTPRPARVSNAAENAVRAGGLILTTCLATLVVWAYVRQPQTLAEVAGSLSASVGAYRIDQQSFDEGRGLFLRDQFAAAQAAFARADPARQDARTQFYLAYTFYRQGWGRLYSDDLLFTEGLDAVNRAIALTPAGWLVVADPDLQMTNAGELKAELEAGVRRDASDFNPLRVFRQRK